jgi:hypothetical protein
MATLTIYAVRNREGRYFRAKGYGGGGDSWVDGLETARLYVKLGPARSVVSWFAKHHPTFGVPLIVEFTATETGTVDESERVAKGIARREAREAKWRAYRASEERKRDERELERLKRKLEGVTR